MILDINEDWVVMKVDCDDNRERDDAVAQVLGSWSKSYRGTYLMTADEPENATWWHVIGHAKLSEQSKQAQIGATCVKASASWSKQAFARYCSSAKLKEAS